MYLQAAEFYGLKGKASSAFEDPKGYAGFPPPSAPYAKALFRRADRVLGFALHLLLSMHRIIMKMLMTPLRKENAIPRLIQAQRLSNIFSILNISIQHTTRWLGYRPGQRLRVHGMGTQR